MTSSMSYGWFGDAGTIVSSAASARSSGIGCTSTRGGSSTLLFGMNDSSSRISSDALLIVVDREVRDAALLVVRHRAAELLLRHLLVRHGADARPGPVTNM